MEFTGGITVLGGMEITKAPPTYNTYAMFGYGYVNTSNNYYTTINLVSNTGVVANDSAGAGSPRSGSAAAGYGNDKGIFAYGYTGFNLIGVTNLVSNTGVVATDTAGVGTARWFSAAACYGTDKAIFGYGANNGASAYYSLSNLVSNTGVMANDTAGVGTARYGLAADILRYHFQ